MMLARFRPDTTAGYPSVFDPLESVHAKSMVILMVPAFALLLQHAAERRNGNHNDFHQVKSHQHANCRHHPVPRARHLAINSSGERGYSNWELSADRANASRRELIAGGINENKMEETLSAIRTLRQDSGDWVIFRIESLENTLLDKTKVVLE